jgi:outer membrane protein OmpA-like peptidoglycan-associated protein
MGRGTMTPRKILLCLAVAIIAITGARSSFAAHNADVVTVNPASDGTRYISIYDSIAMPQWSFNAGGYFDYAYEPLEYADAAGNRRRGIVDDLIMMNIQGAIAWTDWWTMGVNFPMAIYETFYNPNQAATQVAKQTLYAKLGDVRVEMKFRLLNIERFHFGISVIPFFYFPTGKEEYFVGNGMWSPGGVVAFEGDIKNRVFLALNAGYRNYANTRYDVNNPNAVIDDTLILNGGINVRITDSWAVTGEVLYEGVLKGLFKNQLQNPTEFLVGGAWTPQSKAKGLKVQLAGGRGITTGIGSPDLKILASVNYRRVHEPPPPPPVEVEAAVEEKIVITQKIHFEFDRAVIRSISYPILDDVAYLLQRNPQIQLVRVEGHTDWIGPDAYNQNLSERRADSVRNYLIQKGIDPSRMVAVGYGETRPIADNNTVKGRARNRRTEFTVVNVAQY